MLLFATILFGFHGIIENDTTWSDTAYLTGDVLVDSGVTLTIAPGAVVLYADSCEWDTAWSRAGLDLPKTINEWIDLIVEGSLKAIGDQEDSIYFREEFINNKRTGNIVLVNGNHFLHYCSLVIGSGGQGDNTGMICIVNSSMSISNTLLQRGYGIWMKDVKITISNSEFKGKIGLDWRGGGTGHVLQLEGGCLYVDSSSFCEAVDMMGAVIAAINLDTCIITNTKIQRISGFDAQKWHVEDAGHSAGGCNCYNCQYVGIIGCLLSGFYGGNGTSCAGNGLCGGDGFGIEFRNCFNALVDGNQFSGFWGGSGGSGSYSDGSDGDGIAIVCRKSKPDISKNEFISAETEYIYVYSDSTPVIGGSPGKKNRFLNAADRDYVIYNNSPNDIDATWNFWECAPPMIDSLIFDYYDDPTKGIVHYDNFTDVEEEESPAESFTLRSNLVNDVLHVSLSRDYAGVKPRLNLFDASGRRVLSIPVSGSEIDVDVSNFPRGVYFVSVNISEKSRITRKVILN